jgi:hypothetical protein
MKRLNRSNHQMNGENVEVIEVWSTEENEEGSMTLIVSIPMEPNEKLEVEL